MERMGDILARTVNQRARQSQTGPADGAVPPANAQPARPATTRPRPGARPLADSRAGTRGRSLPTPAASGTRRLTPRPLAVRAASSGPLRRVASPTSTPPTAMPGDALELPATASEPARAGAPRPTPADAAEQTRASGDRILELPPRRAASTVRSTGPLNAAGQQPTGDPTPNLSAGGSARTPGSRPGPTTARQFASPLREDAANYTARAARPTTPAAAAMSAVCPICGGAGYVRLDVPLGDPAFGKPVPCECKERQIEERRRSDLRRLSSLDPFLDKTFSTFDGGVQGTHEAFEAARTFAADPEGWIVLSGTHGVGKTHLAAAIANTQLAQGTLVFFSIVPDLLDHLRAAFAPSSEVPYDEMFDKVREAGLLVLDDLGAENSTAWATEKLFQLINYRYNFRMPTVITTNTRLLSHMDERIRSRLSDIGLVRHVAIKAQDYRERHAERRQRAPGASRTATGGGSTTRR